VAVLALAAFFVLGPGLDGLGFGGKDKDDKETADAKDEGGQVAAVGGVSLELTPADALVKIDGKEYPGGSPRVIGDLAVGTHTVEISQGDAYLPLTQEINVVAGQPVSLPLKLHARNVALDIKVDPPTATLNLVAGTTVTAITAKHQLVREPGVEYSIKAAAAGFTETTVPIVFTGDAAQEVPVTLAKQGAAPTPEPVPEPVPTADPDPKPTKKTKKTT